MMYMTIYVMTDMVMEILMLFCAYYLQEDAKICEMIEQFGPCKWSLIAEQLPGRYVVIIQLL